MCDGGVATWKRSSGPRPRAAHQWAVALVIEPWVWRTAFGSPVVPELKTRTASSVSSSAPDATGPAGRAATPATVAGSSRSVTPSGPNRSTSSEADAVSATAWRAPVISRAWPTSAAFHAGLRSTAAAPILLIASTATRNSTRLAVITTTR